MGVLVAQKLEIMRSKIDHQQAPGGPQHPRRLGDRAPAVVEEVQNLVNDDDVEAVPRQCEVVDVRLTHAAMLEPGTIEPRARQRQHVERQIEAEPALDLRPEQLEHAAGAGAEIEQRAHRRRRQRRGDRLLDRRVGDMQLADAVPLGGVAAKVSLGCGGPLRAYGGEPFAIAGERRILRVEASNELARQLGRPAPLPEAEECPRSFTEAFDQPGLGQEPQVARNAWLRLAQNFSEVRDGKLGLPEQSENPQPRGFAGRLQRAVERLELKVGSVGHEVGTVPCFVGLAAFGNRHKDIFIPLRPS